MKQKPEIRDRIKELRRVCATDLVPAPVNWRTHSAKQKTALASVLEEIGIADAVLARELPDGRLQLIDGHLRRETLGESLLPVLVLDVSEREAAILLATIDPLAAMAGTDAEKLDAILREAVATTEGVQELLAEIADDAGLYRDDEKEIVEDEVPEPPPEPITRPGDLWLLGDHRLLCGDSTKAEDVARLMAGRKINVAFTSPPYASQREYDGSSGFRPIPPDAFVDWWQPIQACVKDHLDAEGSFFVNIKEHCEDGQRHLYVNDLVAAHVRKWSWLFVDEFCWRRIGPPGKWPNRFKNGWEPVFHFSVGKAIKFRPDSVAHDSDDSFTYSRKHQRKRKTGSGFSTSDAGRHIEGGKALPCNVIESNTREIPDGLSHPAAFPVSLPAFFVKAYADTGDIILDPFLGSGTTLIAAEQLGRRCYGMEISPQYCDVIVARWEKLTGSRAVLERSPHPPEHIK